MQHPLIKNMCQAYNNTTKCKGYDSLSSIILTGHLPFSTFVIHNFCHTVIIDQFHTRRNVAVNSKMRSTTSVSCFKALQCIDLKV